MKTNEKVVRLTESKLKEMIAEAIQDTLNEGFSDKIKGAIKGAKEGWNYFANRGDIDKRHQGRLKHGTSLGISQDQHDYDNVRNNVNAVLNYIDKMGIDVNESFLSSLSYQLGQKMKNEPLGTFPVRSPRNQ